MASTPTTHLSQERIARLEEAKNAAALQQAVECASLWTESGTPSRDGASRSVGPPVVTDQPASVALYAVCAF